MTPLLLNDLESMLRATGQLDKVSTANKIYFLRCCLFQWSCEINQECMKQSSERHPATWTLVVLDWFSGTNHNFAEGVRHQVESFATKSYRI